MLKKTLYICNRCNKEIKTKGTRIIPHFFDFVTEEMLDEIEVADRDVHFCMDCTQRIMEEILRLPKGKPIENTKKAGKRPKKGERLDAGKVMALYQAGWDNEKIADEMDVTERQIYECIRYQIKKTNSGGVSNGKEQEDEE
ncbi:MAG: DUF433 domain-containing protein [Lachnospiraceae bacterium]|nr:DUF433 domain-containing protein [Lachnospiraceae bacterium]